MAETSQPAPSARGAEMPRHETATLGRPAGTVSEDARRVKAAVLAGQRDKARDAFADLVGGYQRQATRLALYLLRDVTEADEAVQDAFVKVFTHIASYREDLPFEAWFTRILANTCRDRKKARRRRERWEVIGLDRNPEYGGRVENAPALTANPEEALLGDERRREMLKAIDALPERQRTVLLLCHAEGQSPRQVGELTGLNESTVRVHLFRALRKLRMALEGSRVRR
ncbi:MAG: sigma-70 family RNA polymerase sigma factor [Acidobacteria bacterium]|nr:sigma-70 family RNA polymerase sigma factor [Acidobacteriota bacterium]